MEGEEKSRKAVLKAATITAFITTFMGSALNLSIPAMEGDFNVGGAMAGWIVTAYTISVAALSVPFGSVADISGRRRVFLAGVGGFLAISVLCVFAWNIWVLLFLRALQGASAAMIFSTNNAILISAYPDSERGRVLGLSTAATYVGLSAGPVIGGFLNHYMSWHAVFGAAAIAAAVAFFEGYRSIPKDTKNAPEAGPDVAGNLFYVGAVAVSLYGLGNLTAMNAGPFIFAAGIILGVIFVLIERKKTNPVMKITMFTESAPFTLSSLAALLNYGATYAISYLVSIYLQVVMDFTSQTAGLILIVMPLMQALFSPAMGALSDRIKPYKLATCGMLLCVLALLMFSRLSETTGLWYVIASLMTAGFGFSMFASPNTNAIMDCVGPEDYSVANSIVATMRTYGQSASMGTVSVVMGITIGTMALEESQAADLVRTMKISFTVFIVLCIIGVFMSAFRGKGGKSS